MEFLIKVFIFFGMLWLLSSFVHKIEEMRDGF